MQIIRKETGETVSNQTAWRMTMVFLVAVSILLACAAVGLLFHLKSRKRAAFLVFQKKKAVSHKTPQTHLAGPGQGEGDSLPNRCCFFPSRRWTARFLGDKEIEGSCKDKSLKVSRKIQQTIHDDIGLHIGFFQILQPGFSC